MVFFYADAILTKIVRMSLRSKKRSAEVAELDVYSRLKDPLVKELLQFTDPKELNEIRQSLPVFRHAIKRQKTVLYAKWDLRKSSDVGRDLMRKRQDFGRMRDVKGVLDITIFLRQLTTTNVNELINLLHQYTDIEMERLVIDMGKSKVPFKLIAGAISFETLSVQELVIIGRAGMDRRYLMNDFAFYRDIHVTKSLVLVNLDTTTYRDLLDPDLVSRKVPNLCNNVSQVSLIGCQVSAKQLDQFPNLVTLHILDHSGINFRIYHADEEDGDDMLDNPEVLETDENLKCRATSVVVYKSELPKSLYLENVQKIVMFECSLTVLQTWFLMNVIHNICMDQCDNILCFTSDLTGVPPESVKRNLVLRNITTTTPLPPRIMVDTLTLWNVSLDSTTTPSPVDVSAITRGIRTAALESNKMTINAQILDETLQEFQARIKKLLPDADPGKIKPLTVDESWDVELWKEAKGVMDAVHSV